MNRPAVFELECFVAVAEELNFSRAAIRVGLSQPPLSRQIQALEGKLGHRLFERDTRNVTLTSAGRLFLEDARAILSRIDAAVESVRRAGHGQMTRLRLSFIGALSDDALSLLLQRFRAVRPQCQVHLLDLPPGPQMDSLLAGELDGGFIGARPKRLRRELKAVIWQREPLAIALPPNHALANKQSLKLAQCASESWIMVSRAAAPAFRDQFDELCRNAGFHPRIVQESERMAAIATMVAAGQGISMLPASAERLTGNRVRFLPVRGRPKPMLESAFVYPIANTSPDLAAFLALLKAGTTKNRRSDRDIS